MSLAATGLPSNSPDGPRPPDSQGVTIDHLLPAIFGAVEKGTVISQVEPAEVAERIPALCPYSGDNIHAAIALGPARLLAAYVDKVMPRLFSHMEGDFTQTEFKQEYGPTTQEIAHFLLLADSFDCPALILTSSAHVSITSTHEFRGIQRRIELTDKRVLDSTGKCILRFPGRVGKYERVVIANPDRRFEPLRVGTRNSPLVWVERMFEITGPGGIRHAPLARAIGFAPDSDDETLTNGWWHSEGRGKDWVVKNPEGLRLFTRHVDVDAWLLFTSDPLRRRVRGLHLHMGLSEGGKILDINASVRSFDKYIKLNGLTRVAIEKAVRKSGIGDR